MTKRKETFVTKIPFRFVMSDVNSGRVITLLQVLRQADFGVLGYSLTRFA